MFDYLTPSPLALKPGQLVKRSGENRMNKFDEDDFLPLWRMRDTYMSLVSVVGAVDRRLQMWFSICVQNHLQQSCLSLTLKAVYLFASVRV